MKEQLKGREVKVKQALPFIGSSKAVINLRPKEIIVEFIRPSTKQRWLEVYRYPDDHILRHEKLEASVILDGSMSGNGGQWFTIDADLGIQIDYHLGQVTVPVEETQEVKNPDGTVTLKKSTKLQVVDSREWVGIDGVTTWQNEHDLSFAQVAQSQMTDLLKMWKNSLMVFAVVVGLNALVLIAAVLVIGQATGVSMPSLGGGG